MSDIKFNTEKVIEEINKVPINFEHGGVLIREWAGNVTGIIDQSIIELNDVVVRAELAKQFTQLYSINSTGKLFLEINNYAVVKEQVYQVAAATLQIKNNQIYVAKRR